MMEALDAKMDAIMKKLEKLDTIETQLREVHTRMANSEETISRLESEVKDLKKQKKKLEKKVEEFEECLQYNEDDISDIKRDNRKLENDVSELKKQLMYMETYSRREILKFFGLPENSDALDSSNDMVHQKTREKYCTNFWRNGLKLIALAARSSFREFTVWGSQTR